MNHCVIGSIISTTRAICNLFRAVHSARYRFVSIAISLMVFNAKRTTRNREEKKRGNKEESEKYLCTTRNVRTDCFKITQ